MAKVGLETRSEWNVTHCCNAVNVLCDLREPNDSFFACSTTIFKRRSGEAFLLSSTCR